MAGIQMASGFSLRSRQFLDDRQSFKTIAEMASFPESSLPNGFKTLCEEDGLEYQFLTTNEVDATTGKWRVVTGGGSADLTNYYTKTQTDTKISDATNDMATNASVDTKLADYTKTDDLPTSLPASDVKDWAKADVKPSYTADEVGALPDTTAIPSIEGLMKTSDAEDKFVAKETGKGLFSGSYNDLTDKPTIPSLTGYATEEWVEGKNYLTTHQDISGKADKDTTYTKTDVDDALALKANTANVYDKTAIDTMIGNLNHLSKQIVTTLPSVDDAQEDVIYLIEENAGEYSQHLLVTEDGNKVFANLGSTSVDLSQYQKTTDADNKYVAKEDGRTLSHIDITQEMLDAKQDTIANADTLKKFSESTVDDKVVISFGAEGAKKAIAYADAVPEIDDESTDEDKVWSAKKVNDSLVDKADASELVELSDKVAVDSVYKFSNGGSTNNTIHLGKLKSGLANQAPITVEAYFTRADGNTKITLTKNIGYVYKESLGSTSYNDAYITQTSNAEYDIYIQVGSYSRAIVKVIQANNFTYDGTSSAVVGTKISPIELATMDKFGGCGIVSGTTTISTDETGAFNLRHGANMANAVTIIQPTTNVNYKFVCSPLGVNNTYAVAQNLDGSIVMNTTLEVNWVVIGK